MTSTVLDAFFDPLRAPERPTKAVIRLQDESTVFESVNGTHSRGAGAIPDTRGVNAVRI